MNKQDEEDDIVSFIEKLQLLPISMKSNASQDYLDMGESIYHVAKNHFAQQLPEPDDAMVERVLGAASGLVAFIEKLGVPNDGVTTLLEEAKAAIAAMKEGK